MQLLIHPNHVQFKRYGLDAQINVNTPKELQWPIKLNFVTSCLAFRGAIPTILGSIPFIYSSFRFSSSWCRCRISFIHNSFEFPSSRHHPRIYSLYLQFLWILIIVTLSKVLFLLPIVPLYFHHHNTILGFIHFIYNFFGFSSSQCCIRLYSFYP